MKIEEVKQLLEKDKETVTDLNSLNELKVKYLGKKGMLTELNQEIKNIPNEEKKEFGQKVNEVRNNFTNFYEEKKSEFETAILNEKLRSESIDISLPSYNIVTGAPNILE